MPDFRSAGASLLRRRPRQRLSSLQDPQAAPRGLARSACASRFRARDQTGSFRPRCPVAFARRKPPALDFQSRHRVAICQGLDDRGGYRRPAGLGQGIAPCAARARTARRQIALVGEAIVGTENHRGAGIERCACHVVEEIGLRTQIDGAAGRQRAVIVDDFVAGAPHHVTRRAGDRHRIIDRQGIEHTSTGWTANKFDTVGPGVDGPAIQRDADAALGGLCIDPCAVLAFGFNIARHCNRDSAVLTCFDIDPFAAIALGLDIARYCNLNIAAVEGICIDPPRSVDARS